MSNIQALEIRVKQESDRSEQLRVILRQKDQEIEKVLNQIVDLTGIFEKDLL